LVARGGGSLEDLLAFNDEGVARTIAASKLPVVSAVGHETDYSIADFAADVRAPTPSAAAELLSPDMQHVMQDLNALQARLIRQTRNDLQQRQQQLDWISSRLQHPGRTLQEQARRLNELAQRLKRSIGYNIEKKLARIQAAARQLDAISPLQTLQRGYSITRQTDGMLIRQVSQVAEGSRVVTRLADGEFESVVTVLRSRGQHE
jgi:exodeoxyribonuclease VII large subunit